MPRGTSYLCVYFRTYNELLHGMDILLQYCIPFIEYTIANENMVYSQHTITPSYLGEYLK